MYSIEQKRAILSWAYPGDKWLEKLSKMSDAQIHNVYTRMMNNGKLKGIHSNVNPRQPR